ncbi:MAG TPA: membrane protein insertase YidC [Streptosporangiaceae bacterium]|nr:membrane protein insertase YidC [Streptosporangiaceae bacterium]
MSILNPINDLVAWVIMHIYSVLGPVFGATSGVTWVLSIIILVVAMRLILLPLFIKQMHTQRAMTALTPKISEIRKKYKGDKEKLNAETMKLYQEAGVNPLMGCLPVVLQMPLFFALFSVLRAIAEAKPHEVLPYHLTTSFVNNVGQAEIFGVSVKDTFLHGTSLHVHVVVLFVVLVSMLTTYLTVRQSMKRGMMPTGSDSPMGQSQKIMAYVMPLFALTGLYWPFGLVLYWVTTNLWTLGQQYMLLRKYPVGAAAAATGGNLPIGKGAAPAPASGMVASGTSRAKPSPGKRPADSPSGSGKPAPSSHGSREAASGSNGHKPAAEAGGAMRRLIRNRPEPEPEPSVPAQPETKIVRQQPQRQSRSKRSGKR